MIIEFDHELAATTDRSPPFIEKVNDIDLGDLGIITISGEYGTLGISFDFRYSYSLHLGLEIIEEIRDEFVLDCSNGRLCLVFQTHPKGAEFETKLFTFLSNNEEWIKL